VTKRRIPGGREALALHLAPALQGKRGSLRMEKERNLSLERNPGKFLIGKLLLVIILFKTS